MLMFAAATGTTQPDYIALAMVLVLLLVVAVMAIRKRFAVSKNAQPGTVEAVPPATPEESAKPTAPGSAGELKLHDVEPKTAAMLMAIVADKMDKPLNELRFLSIKEVK